MEASGERTIMSAPMPRVRTVVSSTKPRLSPTSVSMRVTGTPISKMLKMVRVGRWARFVATSAIKKKAPETKQDI